MYSKEEILEMKRQDVFGCLNLATINVAYAGTTEDLVKELKVVIAELQADVASLEATDEYLRLQSVVLGDGI